MIPVSEPWLGDREREYVEQCLASGWISSSGEFLDRFEAEWAAYCGRAHGIAVTSGTTALQLAVAALGLEPGAEIVMPSFTIVSCATAALYCGARPVLVDADPETWCMDVAAIEAKLTPRTAAIMPVHIYGHPVEMGPLLELADRHGLALIEDAAEAHGAECLVADSWRRCGSFGALSCFSFYANKIVTTGEGGIVVTDDETLAATLRSLRNLGFGPGRRFLHEQLGFNFRMTNLQAAIGSAQIERIDEALRRKRALAGWYAERLADTPGLQLPVERNWARNVYWMYGVLLDEGHPEPEELARQLASRGVETRPFFLGLHQQPVLRAMGLFDDEQYPVTERLARRGLYLPSGLTLTERDADRVAAAVREGLG